jgi:hypothetical protein
MENSSNAIKKWCYFPGKEHLGRPQYEGMGNVWERKDLLYALERVVSSAFLDESPLPAV